MHSTSLSLSVHRIHSRPSSSASIRSNPSTRARSPSLILDDPGNVKSVLSTPSVHHFILTPVSTVSIRHHMSSLKHSIRHQQAQLQNLENLLQRTPRMSMSMSLNSSASPPPSPLPDPSPSDLPPSTPNPKVKRRSSFDVLHSLAGPDSSLPLPCRDTAPLSQDGIREGVPMDFATGQSSQSYKRQMSPTRTLSRACQMIVSRDSLGFVTDHNPASRHTHFLRRSVTLLHLYCLLYRPNHDIHRECPCPRR
jgi:hypothetical protein